MPGDRVPPSAPLLSDRVYGAAASVASTVAQIASRAAGASRADLASRRGALPSATSPLFWLHGASAGEMAAAANLVDLLRGAGLSFTAGFTTTNAAGLDWLCRRAPADAAVSLAPWDAPRHVERAFDRWRPRAVFLIETEIWPSFILAAVRRRVPIFSVSSRIYPRDVARYRWARPFLAPTFGRLTAVLAQSETERQRFVGLGVSPERCFVAGNLKHLTSAETGGSRRQPGLVVCGSMHADELGGLFTTLESVASPSRRFVVAPRHPAGVAVAVREAERRGWTVAKRSEATPDTGWRVLVLDTMGELASLYAGAELAVVGGSFGRHGGHNPYEPVRAGTPVFFGVHCDHFEEEARRLAAHAAESQVCDWSELGARLHGFLGDDHRRQDFLGRQTEALPDAASIGERYVEILSNWLVPASVAATGGCGR